MCSFGFNVHEYIGLEYCSTWLLRMCESDSRNDDVTLVWVMVREICLLWCISLSCLTLTDLGGVPLV